MMFGGTEILVVAGVVFLLFGASMLPKWARAMGQARKELDKLNEDEDDE